MLKASTSRFEIKKVCAKVVESSVELFREICMRVVNVEERKKFSTAKRVLRIFLEGVIRGVRGHVFDFLVLERNIV